MLNFKNCKTKFGFSLFEVLVTVGIVAIFIAACSNVFTQKHKTRTTTPIHGHYECYIDPEDGKVHERTFNDRIMTSESTPASGECNFVPPKFASYIIINAVAGGGHGGDNYGGSAGKSTNMFLSKTDHRLKIIPGKRAANKNESGKNTLIYDTGLNGTDNKLIRTLKGGRSDSGNSMDFSDCTVNYSKYTCGVAANCIPKGVAGNKVFEVTFCTADSGLLDPGDKYARIVNIPFKGSPVEDKGFDDNCLNTNSTNTLPAAFKNKNKITSVYDTYGAAETAENNMKESGGILVYDYTKYLCKDPTSSIEKEERKYFSINITVDGNFTEYSDPSPIMGHINSLHLEDGIGKVCKKDKLCKTEAEKAANGLPLAGEGGAKGTVGGHGGAIIVW